VKTLRTLTTAATAPTTPVRRGSAPAAAACGGAAGSVGHDHRPAHPPGSLRSAPSQPRSRLLQSLAVILVAGLSACGGGAKRDAAGSSRPDQGQSNVSACVAAVGSYTEEALGSPLGSQVSAPSYLVTLISAQVVQRVGATPSQASVEAAAGQPCQNLYGSRGGVDSVWPSAEPVACIADVLTDLGGSGSGITFPPLLTPYEGQLAASIQAAMGTTLPLQTFSSASTGGPDWQSEYFRAEGLVSTGCRSQYGSATTVAPTTAAPTTTVAAAPPTTVVLPAPFSTLRVCSNGSATDNPPPSPSEEAFSCTYEGNYSVQQVGQEVSGELESDGWTVQTGCGSADADPGTYCMYGPPSPGGATAPSGQFQVEAFSKGVAVMFTLSPDNPAGE